MENEKCKNGKFWKNEKDGKLKNYKWKSLCKMKNEKSRN